MNEPHKTKGLRRVFVARDSCEEKLEFLFTTKPEPDRNDDGIVWQCANSGDLAQLDNPQLEPGECREYVLLPIDGPMCGVAAAAALMRGETIGRESRPGYTLRLGEGGKGIWDNWRGEEVIALNVDDLLAIDWIIVPKEEPVS